MQHEPECGAMTTSEPGQNIETWATVTCPHCAETVTIALDAGGGGHQEYVEDCEVCCRPWHVEVRFRDGAAEVHVRDDG